MGTRWLATMLVMCACGPQLICGEHAQADEHLSQPFSEHLPFALFAERRRDTARGTGIMGDATAEKGKRIFELACHRLEALVREYRDQPVRRYREFGSHCP